MDYYVDESNNSLDERCQCGQLLCKICQNEYIEIKCRRCKRLCIISIRQLEKAAQELPHTGHDRWEDPREPELYKKTSTSARTRYLALESSDRFHVPECRWAMQIRRDCIITFDSREEALDCGYRPCRVCNP